MIDFDAYYQHRKKDFLVVVGMPAWWDSEKHLARIKPPVVLVMRCGLTDGRTKWLMNAEAFEKTYKKHEVPP